VTTLGFDIATLRDAYGAGRLSPRDVVGEALKRIEAYSDPAVWIARVPESNVLARAAELAGHPNPEALPLFGIPFAVKDNIDCAGLATTAGCPAFAYTSDANAPAVDKLLAAGAILMGKTNLDQFATGLVGTRSPHGAPRCVFNADYVSGGSSSGSAVAVAAGLVAFSLGTDTAGSGRVPAAFNNIVGLKPSRGLISTRGVVPACRTLDCVSIFASTVGDADAVLQVTQAYDALDFYSRRSGARHLPQERFRFGVLAQDARVFDDAEQAALYEQTIARLASLGGEPVEIDFEPFRKAGPLLYEGAWTAERLASIKQFANTHADSMDPTVRRIILNARELSAVDAFEGQYRLADYARAAEAEWERMDVLLLPTAPGQPTVAQVAADPIGRNAALGRYTNFVNLLDYCAIAVPAGFRSNGLAFGVTLIASAFADSDLCVIADRLHRAHSFGMGVDRNASLPDASRMTCTVPSDYIDLFVVGAHLSGMPLNGELKNLGATFRREARTVPDYRLYVLPDTQPAKPGLVRVPGTNGPGITGEIWALPLDSFGRFVAAIPCPLGIGKVMLSDSTSLAGFVCEAYAVSEACEITQMGGWRTYMSSR
jgi:allophanate hydrolase